METPETFRGLAGPGAGPYYSHERFRGRPMAQADLELMQGTLDLLVLKALVFGARHGYAVARWVGETTDDDLQIEEGALYTALHRMERRGWIEAEWGQSDNNRRAKFYELTTTGRSQLRARTRTWTRYARAVSKVLATAEG